MSAGILECDACQKCVGILEPCVGILEDSVCQILFVGILEYGVCQTCVRSSNVHGNSKVWRLSGMCGNSGGQQLSSVVCGNSRVWRLSSIRGILEIASVKPRVEIM
jgi:hypothetical protein